MKSNKTKDLIIHKATELFYEKGYDGTTNREIAHACSIALGNFNYYYSKKEDVLNDLISKGIDSFKDYVSFDDKPIISFLSFHYAFIHYIIANSNLLNLYIKCGYLPSVKEKYIQKMIDLIKSYCTIDEFEIIISNFCCIEFNMIEMYNKEKCNIDTVYEELAKVLLFYTNESLSLIPFSIEQGKIILKNRMKNKDLYF